MGASELAQELSRAALDFRAGATPEKLTHVEMLARAAAAHVRRAGQDTVDHIVLNSMLSLIAADISHIRKVLDAEGWVWL